MVDGRWSTEIMGIGKWIVGALGWAMFGPIGGILGYYFTSKIEQMAEQSVGQTEDQSWNQGQRNSFLMSGWSTVDGDGGWSTADGRQWMTTADGRQWMTTVDGRRQMVDGRWTTEIMGIGKWIVGALGWAMFGPIGGILGYYFTSKIEQMAEQSVGQTEDQSWNQGQRNSFLMSGWSTVDGDSGSVTVAGR